MRDAQRKALGAALAADLDALKAMRNQLPLSNQADTEWLARRTGAVCLLSAVRVDRVSQAGVVDERAGRAAGIAAAAGAALSARAAAGSDVAGARRNLDRIIEQLNDTVALAGRAAAEVLAVRSGEHGASLQAALCPVRAGLADAWKTLGEVGRGLASIHVVLSAHPLPTQKHLTNLRGTKPSHTTDAGMSVAS
jgi:hypothetical protein